MKRFGLKTQNLFEEIINAQENSSIPPITETVAESKDQGSNDSEKISNGVSHDLKLEPQNNLSEFEKDSVQEKFKNMFISDEVPIKIKFYYSRIISS